MSGSVLTKNRVAGTGLAQDATIGSSVSCPTRYRVASSLLIISRPSIRPVYAGIRDRETHTASDIWAEYLVDLFSCSLNGILVPWGRTTVQGWQLGMNAKNGPAFWALSDVFHTQKEGLRRKRTLTRAAPGFLLLQIHLSDSNEGYSEAEKTQVFDITP